MKIFGEILTAREKRILWVELKLASKDSKALVGSLLGALSFISLAGINVALPPLVWLSVRWSQICEIFWKYLFIWIPFKLELTNFATDSCSFFMVIGLMFLRGRYFGYVGLNKFSIQAQDLFSRLLFYLLVAYTIVRLHSAIPYIVEVHPFSSLIFFMLSLLLGYKMFVIYVRFLRRAKIIPRLLANGWLILLGPALIILINGSLRHSPATLPDGLGAQAVAIGILISKLFLIFAVFFFGLPISVWFIRIVSAMIIVAGLLIVLDLAWAVLQSPPAVENMADASLSGSSKDVKLPILQKSQDLSDSEIPSKSKPIDELPLMCPEADAPISLAILKPTVGHFSEVLKVEGAHGTVELVERCYASLGENSPKLMDRCLAFELVASGLYGPLSAYYKSTAREEGLSFFSSDSIKARITFECQRQKIEPECCRQRALKLDSVIRPDIVKFIAAF